MMFFRIHRIHTVNRAGVIGALDTLFRPAQFVFGRDRAKLVYRYDAYVKIGVPISAALTPAPKKFKSIIDHTVSIISYGAESR